MISNPVIIFLPKPIDVSPERGALPPADPSGSPQGVKSSSPPGGLRQRPVPSSSSRDAAAGNEGKVGRGERHGARRFLATKGNRRRSCQQSAGFSLLVTLTIMMLLLVIGVGLLSLSVISLRSSTVGDARARATANARLAVVMAIGELQTQTGDDRRITADASILGSVPQPQLVGVWSSWSPGLTSSPTDSAPNYETEKEERFRSWLVSSPNPEQLENPDWAQSTTGNDWIELFSADHDGFDLRAEPVTTESGSLAWAVSQENTKVKLNVAGPDTGSTTDNTALQVQVRPTLSLSGYLKDPESGWNLRSSRLLSMNQVRLDSELVDDTDVTAEAGAIYTAHAQGVLADVVRGGLKTDLNLGFEMEDSDFAKDSWGDVANPFRSSSETLELEVPASYDGQRPLFRPLTDNAIVSVTTDYWPASVANRFYAASVPTFDHLRSFYRIPHHLYGGTTPVVAERGPDSVAVEIDSAAGGSKFAPANPPQGETSQLSVRPVLNRLVYLLSSILGSDGRVRLLMTPVVVLWNPYNIDLEIEGAVAYPWGDIPFRVRWDIEGTTGEKSYEVLMSKLMGKQFAAQNHGRSVDPYFFCEMTANGDGDTNTPIHFEPGELRIFVPSSTTPVEFERLGSNAARTVQMRPVDRISDMNTKGGLSVPMRGGLAGEGFDYTVTRYDKVRTEVEAMNNDYHYFVALEDATRIKNSSDDTRGEAVTEVQVLGFASAVTKVTSPFWSYNELRSGSQPFGVLETYHRVAKTSVGGQPIADLVYTTNPRQISINHQLSRGSFTVAPHFESSLRAVSSFDGAIQTSFDGRNAFWGASQSSSGRSHLPFFELPREPMLSLASFQHADLSSSTFSPSNQFGNSWSNPYLGKNRAALLNNYYISEGVPIYDTAYLTNEALWDGFFFSGAVPHLYPAGSSSPEDAWDSDIAQESRSIEVALREFVTDPLNKPLSNPRMRLVKGSLSDDELVEQLLEPAGCAKIAAHLLVDGAFNVNSTNVDAWTALLAGLRGQSFEVDGGSSPSGNVTAFPRFRHPNGSENDIWNGFRTLDDGQVEALAEKIVEQVIERGPFLSLAEFVNRQVSTSDLANSGAIQAAIDGLQFNENAKQASFDTSKYPRETQKQIINDTGVGIPGYLTQGDVLQSLAPVITPRSDTFTIRGYGEATNSAGEVIARAMCEAVVQRMPEFVDPSTPAYTPLTSASTTNQTFGRRYQIVAFRQVPFSELN